MLTEVLKIQPKLDNNELNQMERQLGSRFSRIAKGFGRGLKIASAAALGAAVLDRLINPLQEVKAAIERTLGKADDVVTNAKQFNTTTENLLKLRALAQTRGVTPENLDLLLSKFQGAVAQAAANPNDPSVSSVKNFAGEKDTAVAFFNFITALQKMEKNQQRLIQEQVFGEKQVLKMAEFLQDNGFKESAQAIKNVNFQRAAKGAEFLAAKNDQIAANRTVNDMNDLSNKARVIDNGTIRNMNQSELNNLNRENGRISRSDQMFTAEERMAEIQDNLEKLVNETLTKVPEIMDALKGITGLLQKSVEGWSMMIQLIKTSPMFKGIKSMFGGKGD